MQHNWIKSTLGHGETMCSRCFVTNREAAALDIANVCDAPEPKPTPTNDNTPQASQFSQDQIDDEMICDDEEDDMSSECGRWNGGHLTRQCRLAGTEWCDWDCPIGC